jgi:hypothetical protein
MNVDIMVRAMIRPLAMVLLGVAFAAVHPDLAAGQQQPGLQLGVWHGWLTRGTDDSTRVLLDVEADKKHLYITMRARNSPDYGMSGVKLKDDVLTFDWYVGLNAVLQCRLSRRGGPGFDGMCIDRTPGADGKQLKVWLNMMPPDSTERGGTEWSRVERPGARERDAR